MGSEGLKVDEINSKVTRYWRVSVIEETTSTQSDLINNFQPGNVLVAEFQSAGRGRLDRKFEVPPRKGLTFSFCVERDNDLGWLPLLTGLAVSRAINRLLPSDNMVKIKWPNDLILNGKKLAGILSEKVANGAVIGVGINISQSIDELPIPEAISLDMVAQVDRNSLLIEILNELKSVLEDWESEKSRYRAACSTIGKQVKAQLPGGEIIEATATGIAKDGALILANPANLDEITEIRVADIVHLR